MLTDKQLRVLKLLSCDGLKTARISEKTGTSSVNVTKHLRAIRKNLGAKTNPHAVYIAFQKGILKKEEDCGD